MELERRDQVKQYDQFHNYIYRMKLMTHTKPFSIPKRLVWQAWKAVKSNAGGAGIDDETLALFEQKRDKNLYKLWNRLSSGTYFPAPVKAVPIPKKQGGERILGIPTVTDRIAQTVVKLVFEPQVEPYFYEDSYGYRPNKSALDAVGVTRKRCWEYDWVLEYDIKGLFDNIDHDALMSLVRKHSDEKWILLYIERWLKVPMQRDDGSLIERPKGTPQGGVISPLLANLFLHYVQDCWLSDNYPRNKWCRYADDGVVHCRTEEEAKKLLEALKQRFDAWGLELHPKKTKIVYCKDDKRKGDYPTKSFDFLGYCFRPRLVKNSKTNGLFVGFSPGVSRSSLKAMRETIRKMKVKIRSSMGLTEIAKWCNPILSGWINYYGRFNRSSLSPFWRYFNKMLVKWAMRKYKKLRRRKSRTIDFFDAVRGREPGLFAHWKHGMKGAFA
jgi:RNA-directed DNA polymerase